jgi:CRISPR-associated protein Csd1
MQRLVACRIDSKQIPLDIIKALVNKASNPQAYEEKVWRNMIFTACAVLNKHYMKKDRIQKGHTSMGWTLDENNRSFQFGRLIAAMEKAEQDYYYQSGDSGGDKKTRMTTAIKALNSFRQKPFSTYARVQEHLTQAYIPRLNQPARIRYEKLKGEIMGRIADYPKEDLNKPLEDIYLLGYDLQRNAFFTKTSGESMGEGETEKP